MKSTRNRSRLADQGTKEMLPVIFSLAWPTMLEQLMQTAVQYMDTGMVGVLGTSATAAVGATSTVNWLIGSTISAISIGFLAYISQSIGAGKKEQAKKASGQSPCLDAGRSFYSETGIQLFPDPLCTDAFSNCEHYFWNCPEGSGRYQNPYAGRSCL